jgi:hypothetical protein
MLSIQEMVDKTKTQRREVEALLDSSGSFHPEKASILDNQKAADYYALKQSLEKIPLREFLAKSGTAGIAGAIYMIPDKVHSTLVAASYRSDKVPLFSAQVVNGWRGGDLIVDIAVRQSVGGAKAEGGKWSLHPKRFSSGGKMSEQTVETAKATLAPKSFSVPFTIAEDLIESSAFDLIQWHIDHGAQQIGQYATDLAIADLKAASDGDGTQCAVTASADSTTSAEVLSAIEELGSELWNPDTLICTHKAWADAICVTASHSGVVLPPPPEGYNAKFQCLDVILNNSSNLYTDVTSGLMTNCISLALDRSAALLCGRKRWMQIEKYANPMSDLAGAVVSCRQDCVTLYKDASCEITEA